jgi:preprotein translocase subunit SecD
MTSDRAALLIVTLSLWGLSCGSADRGPKPAGPPKVVIELHQINEEGTLDVVYAQQDNIDISVDPNSGFELTTSFSSGRPIVFRKIPDVQILITEVESARPTMSKRGPAVEVLLGAGASKRVQEFTKANLKKRIAFRVNGQVIIAPHIDEEISKRIQFWGFSNAQAIEFSEYLNGHIQRLPIQRRGAK